jgi:hypothetical protein
MAPFQPTNGIDCGPFHIPCWEEKKMNFSKAFLLNVDRALNYAQRKLKLDEER